jgi:hypothetical protein
MKKIASVLIALLASAGFHASAAAWASANRYGGHTTSGAGQTEHTNAYGGSTTHNWDGGTSHTNAAGGTTTGMYGAGAVHTTDTGYSTYHPPAYGAPGYAPYHPPVPVYSSGCYNCAGAVAAGVIVGAAVGSAVATNNAAVATSNAYAAGVAAGVTYSMGVNYANPPPGAGMVTQGGNTYYLAGNTWFKASYGANGVYYTVVPAP